MTRSLPPLPPLQVSASTRVTFPAGAVGGRSPVVGAAVLRGAAASRGAFGVLVEETPFHPLDHSWPDQPGDTGTLAVGGDEVAVADTLTGAVGPAGELLVGADIPAKRGEAGFHWVAVHVVERLPAAAAAGAAADLRVDPGRRAALSAAHTGCHLLAFALNAELAVRWRKEARADALGNPDFDAVAVRSSRLGTAGSTDVHRLGKSLRKKGFSTEGLAEELPELTARVNARLAEWVAGGSPVLVEADGPFLTDRRRWACPLPEGTAALACGGTHLRALTELASLTAELALAEDASELTTVTTPVRRAA